MTKYKAQVVKMVEGYMEFHAPEELEPGWELADYAREIVSNSNFVPEHVEWEVARWDNPTIVDENPNSALWE